jgi:hypothetical protein
MTGPVDETAVLLYDSSETHELLHMAEKSNSIIRGIIRRKDNHKVKAVSHYIELPVIVSPTQTIKEVLKVDNGIYTFTRGYEATAIRVWTDDGVVHASTHKRIDPSNSRWGNTASFSEMYSELNGPTDILFNQPDSNENWCFMFLMVCPPVMIGTFDPETNYIIFIGCIDTAEPSRILLPTTDFITRTMPDVRLPSQFTVDEAEIYLQYGWGRQPSILGIDGIERFVDPEKDTRLGTGEFVIATKWKGEPWLSDIESIDQIMSTSYSYRCEIRNNNPNLWNRLFSLSNDARRDINEYNSLYPWISSVMPADKTQQFVGGETGDVVDIADMSESTMSHRLHNLWNVFIYVMPHPLKTKVTTNVHVFHIERYKISRWIGRLHYNKDVQVLDRRVVQIIEFAKKIWANPKNKCRTLYSAIHLVLRTEYGESLYRLWSTMSKQDNISDR